MRFWYRDKIWYKISLKLSYLSCLIYYCCNLMWCKTFSLIHWGPNRIHFWLLTFTSVTCCKITAVTLTYALSFMFNFVIKSRIPQMSPKYISILLSYKDISKPFTFQHIHLITIIFNADKKPALKNENFNLTTKERHCRNRL